MPSPSTSDLHLDVPLTNMMVAYFQDPKKFISDKVFPICPVKKKSDLYYEFNKADWFRGDAKERAPGTESAGGGYGVANSNYACKTYAFHKDIADEERDNADAILAPNKNATRFVSTHLGIRREVNFINKFFSAGLWSGGDFTPGTLWDAAGSDPIGDVDDQKLVIEEATGYRPSVLVVGPLVHRELKHHPDVLDRIKYTQRGQVTEEILASLFEVDKYLVARAVQNTAAKGQTASMSFMYGKHCLLAYATDTPAIDVPSAGYTFAWKDFTKVNEVGAKVTNFRMEQLKSDRIEGELSYDQKITAADLGKFFLDVIS